MNVLSLTKIGNLKLGIVNDGQPIQTENILVTLPTKEGTANFKIYPGFSAEGEKKVNVTLPFNKPSLNFEVNYVGFAQVDDVEYIAKAEKIGDPLILYPLYPELNPDSLAINMGELDHNKIENFKMERTGFLKVMLEGISSYGEVFYFKTKSVNSIRAIQDQLKILDVLTDGNSAGVPLVFKPVKKDVNEKQVVYVSIGFEGSMVDDLGSYIDDIYNSPVNYRGLEDLYEESRILEEDEVVDFEDVKENIVIKVVSDGDSGIASIATEKARKEMGENSAYVSEVISKIENTNKIGMDTFVALFNSFKLDKERFEEFINEPENISFPKIVKTIKDNGRAA